MNQGQEFNLTVNFTANNSVVDTCENFTGIEKAKCYLENWMRWLISKDKNLTIFEKVIKVKSIITILTILTFKTMKKFQRVSCWFAKFCEYKNKNKNNKHNKIYKNLLKLLQNKKC